MGFAKTSQLAGGIHTRLFSRAFIFREEEEEEEAAPHSSVVFVSVDVGMIGQMVKKRVMDNLGMFYGADVYHAGNVLISATHTHSGPAGYLQYLLFNVATMGFNKDTFDSIVQGITKVRVYLYDISTYVFL